MSKVVYTAVNPRDDDRSPEETFTRLINATAVAVVGIPILFDTTTEPEMAKDGFPSTKILKITVEEVE